jgi:hypothetical protein
MKTFRNTALSLILATTSMAASAVTVTIPSTSFNCTGLICGIFAVTEVEIDIQIPGSSGVFGATQLDAEIGDPNVVLNKSTVPLNFVGDGYTDTATTTFVGIGTNPPTIGDTPEAAGVALTVSGGVLTGKLAVFGTGATSGLRVFAVYDFDNETFLAFTADTAGGSSQVGDGTFVNPGAAVVPVPAAVWLFGSGLLGLVGVARRKAS